MLSVGKVGPGNADYYVETVAQSHAEYYGGEGESAGRWFGRADLIGATAGVEMTEADARLLLEARSAPDGTLLGRSKVDERSVTALDLTMSAPKSVSVLYALANEEQLGEVLDAQTAAVEAAIEHVNRHASFTRVGKAGAGVVDSEGLIGARFRHRTSRAMDPQLHDHCLVVNAVQTVADGQWRTIDARQVYRHAKAGGVVYQSALRAELTSRLGVQWGEISEHGQADIVGVDPRLMEAWSQRSADIEGDLDEWTKDFEEREGREPSAAEVGRAHKAITLNTRQVKDGEASEETTTLRERWAVDARELGVDVEAMLGEMVGPSLEVEVRTAHVADVLEAVELSHAEWGEAQIVEQIASRTVGRTAAEVAEMVERTRQLVMQSDEVVELARAEVNEAPAGLGAWPNRADGRPVWVEPSAVRYTTRSHLAKEEAIVAWASLPADPTHRSCAVSNVEGLDEGQADAVRSLVEEPSTVNVVVGPAGTGKTRMLNTARCEWEASGVEVRGLGPSARAAEELSAGAGIRSDTLAKLLDEHRDSRPRPEWNYPAHCVVVIDEAGMASTNDLHEFSQLALQNQWRTVLVGDHRQLSAVDAGGMFAELVVTEAVPVVELESIHRFSNEWEATASQQLRQHDPAALTAYQRHGRISGYENGEEAMAHVIREAQTGIMNGRDVLVMAPTRNETSELNRLMVEALTESGRLDAEQRFFINGERGQQFLPGQVVVTRQNDRRLRVGEGWVRNGDRWTVTGRDDQGRLQVESKDGQRIGLPADYVAEHVESGYASTVHRAQGATVDEAHLLVNERTSPDALYVGMTRGRNVNQVHVARPTHDPDTHHEQAQAPTWKPVDTLADINSRTESTNMAAITRQRQLRERLVDPKEISRRIEAASSVRAMTPMEKIQERLGQVQADRAADLGQDHGLGY